MFTVRSSAHTLAGLAAAALALLVTLLLAAPAPVAAQQCLEIASGDDIRFDYGSADVKGSIVTLGEDRVRVKIQGVEQTLDRHSTLANAEVRCRVEKGRGSGVGRSVAVGAIVGSVTGYIVGSIMQEPAPPPEQVCIGWLPCWTYERRAPTPPVNLVNGALAGAGLGLVWGLLRSVDRDWVPLARVGSELAIEPTVEPTPGEPGTWSVGLRVPLGSRP